MRRASSASPRCSLGGALDFVWHSIFGFEHQLDLLLSPPHLFLLTGLFFLITGPVRSALRRPNAPNLIEQLPMLISLGLAFEIVQFVTQFGVLSRGAAARSSAFAERFPREQFVLSVLLYYRQALELSIVIVAESLALGGGACICALRKRLHFGALIVLCVAAKLWIGGELSSDRMELLLLVLASIAAGLAGESSSRSCVRRRAIPTRSVCSDSSCRRRISRRTLRLPFRCSAERGGTRASSSARSPSSGLVGLCISQLLLAGSQTNTATA